ncbi:MAG: restriction endonuclease subunit S [Syntrophales bacterium]
MKAKYIWPKVKLLQVTKRIRNGLSVKQDSNSGGLPISRIETISDSIIDPKKVGFADIGDGDRDEWLLQKGDILFSHINSESHIGKCAIYADIPLKLIHGMNLLSLRVNKKLISPEYLCLVLRSDLFKKQLKPIIKRAVNQASVSIGNLQQLTLPLPTLSEQRRIVKILDQADHLCKLRAQSNIKVERILPALFIKRFGNPATNPMGWRITKVREVVKSVNRRDPSQFPDKQFTYIDIAGVDGTKGKILSAKRLIGADAPSRARQVIQTNDTLVSTVRPYLRATATVSEDFDGEIASTGFCVLRPKQHYGYSWLYVLTRLQWFTERLNERARGASYPAVTDTDIFDLQIPVPEHEKLLCLFDNEVNRLRQLDSHRILLDEKIGSLFSMLMYRACSGALTAAWREAHMKELLVEMEQQTKALNDH